MTLCAVWRSADGRIHVAADSRAGFGSSHADVAVKIGALPMRLSHARDATTQRADVEADQILGCAVVGSLTTTYIAKALLEPILASLQFAEGWADTSIEGISHLAATVLGQVSREVCQAIFGNGLGQIILVGHCINSNTGRAFVLTTAVLPTGVGVTVRELLVDHRVEFLGSGTPRARELHRIHSTWPASKIVREVCIDVSEPTVGGYLQYGKLEDRSFRVLGVRDYRVSEVRKEVYASFTFSGIEIVGGKNLFGDSGFFMQESFIDPFASEIDALTDSGYFMADSMDGWPDPV